MARSDQTCTDGAGGEDTDCDGFVDEGCREFGTGDDCRSDLDCLSGFCDGTGQCGVATCPNGVQDGNETDVDCGGLCPACTTGQLCLTDSDCASNNCLNFAGEDRCAGGLTPGAGSVVVTELLVNPAGADQTGTSEGEWFEIYNPTATPFDLKGCEIRNLAGSGMTIPDSVVIAPGAYAVLAERADSPFLVAAGVTPAYVYTGLAFRNGTPDGLRITCGGTLVDEFLYPYDPGQEIT